MLNFASAAKARSRTVTLTRPSRDEVLHLSIVGGFERGFGIFIAVVDKVRLFVCFFLLHLFGLLVFHFSFA